VSKLATYGVIAGGGGDAIPPLVSGGGGGILPSVVFPPSVIFPPCANAGIIIDNPPADATAAVAKAADATNNVASIFLFKFEVIAAE
jgi:hypothetical protein